MNTTTRPVRVASVCHDADDYRNRGHRRVKLALYRKTNQWGENVGYVWQEADTGADCCIGACKTVSEAEAAALDAWGAAVWDFRASWAH